MFRYISSLLHCVVLHYILRDLIVSYIIWTDIEQTETTFSVTANTII